MKKFLSLVMKIDIAGEKIFLSANANLKILGLLKAKIRKDFGLNYKKI